jgi:pantetheine-phosphate adenylyltransferase
VVVGENPRKKALFPLQERYSLIRQSTANRKNVRVKVFKGLLVDYISKNEKAIFIRGLRAVSDFEYELQMAMMNRKLNPNVETVFLMPNEKYIFLSSSLIQDIARNRGKIDPFVPGPVKMALKKKFK